MEFEDLRQIWDVQNNKPLYVIDEEALHRHIDAKKKKALHITNVSELLLIIVNSVAGSFVVIMNLYNQKANVYMYMIALWMFATALYSLMSRVRRIKESNKFDRTIQGDLDHALSVASYQVVFSQLMRWNVIPISLFTFAGLWAGSKSIWMIIGVLLFFALAYYLSGWEHGIYKNRKRELELLHKKLSTGSSASE